MTNLAKYRRRRKKELANKQVRKAERYSNRIRLKDIELVKKLNPLPLPK